jgi:hypothetical protein
MPLKNRQARSFVTIIVVVAALTLILRIAIEQVMHITIIQNESSAEANLKLISTALENYALDHQGVFPDNFSVLSKAKPLYLDNDYISLSPIKGYNYSCSRLEHDGYNCFVSPTKCGITGNKVFYISTGGSLVSEECSEAE